MILNGRLMSVLRCVLLLLIHCLLLPLFVWVLCLLLVLLFSTLSHSCFAIILMGNRELVALLYSLPPLISTRTPDGIFC